MPPRLFVLNLSYFFSASKMHDVLNGCRVTSVELARTIHGVLASVETLTEADAARAETLLNALKLPPWDHPWRDTDRPEASESDPRPFLCRQVSMFSRLRGMSSAICYETSL